MKTIESMYYDLLSEIQKSIKSFLSETIQGKIWLGASNGFYTNPTFEVPVQQIDKKYLIREIHESLNYLPICYLGILQKVDIQFKIKNDENNFGKVTLQIIPFFTFNKKYIELIPNTSIFKIIQEYDKYRLVTVKEKL